jgi:hypothetical protein
MVTCSHIHFLKYYSCCFNLLLLQRVAAQKWPICICRAANGPHGRLASDFAKHVTFGSPSPQPPSFSAAGSGQQYARQDTNAADAARAHSSDSSSAAASSGTANGHLGVRPSGTSKSAAAQAGATQSGKGHATTSKNARAWGSMDMKDTSSFPIHGCADASQQRPKTEAEPPQKQTGWASVRRAPDQSTSLDWEAALCRGPSQQQDGSSCNHPSKRSSSSSLDAEMWDATPSISRRSSDRTAGSNGSAALAPDAASPAPERPVTAGAEMGAGLRHASDRGLQADKASVSAADPDLTFSFAAQGSKQPAAEPSAHKASMASEGEPARNDEQSRPREREQHQERDPKPTKLPSDGKPSFPTKVVPPEGAAEPKGTAGFTLGAFSRLHNNRKQAARRAVQAGKHHSEKAANTSPGGRDLGEKAKAGDSSQDWLSYAQGLRAEVPAAAQRKAEAASPQPQESAPSPSRHDFDEFVGYAEPAVGGQNADSPSGGAPAAPPQATSQRSGISAAEEQTTGGFAFGQSQKGTSAPGEAPRPGASGTGAAAANQGPRPQVQSGGSFSFGQSAAPTPGKPQRPQPRRGRSPSATGVPKTQPHSENIQQQWGSIPGQQSGFAHQAGQNAWRMAATQQGLSAAAAEPSGFGAADSAGPSQRQDDKATPVTGERTAPSFAFGAGAWREGPTQRPQAGAKSSSSAAKAPFPRGPTSPGSNGARPRTISKAKHRTGARAQPQTDAKEAHAGPAPSVTRFAVYPEHAEAGEFPRG